MHIVFSEPVSAVPARAQGPVLFVSYGDLAWNVEAGGRDCSVAASKGAQKPSKPFLFRTQSILFIPGLRGNKIWNVMKYIHIELPFQDSKTIAGHRWASEELAGNSGGHLLPGGCTLEFDAQHHTLGLSEQKFCVASGWQPHPVFVGCFRGVGCRNRRLNEVLQP